MSLSLSADLPERGAGEAAHGPVRRRASVPHLPHRPGLHAPSREHQRAVRRHLIAEISKTTKPKLAKCECVISVWVQDGVGSENQGSVGTLHRDGEEEEREGVSR